MGVGVRYGVDVGIGVDSVSGVYIGLAVGIDGMDIRSHPEATRIMISK